MATNAGTLPIPPEADADWRQRVPQSSRNKEVREIATVLASLEPGATSSSKLMLATRFEVGVFNAAGSFTDYKMKLSKRLKKLQKTYKPPREMTPKNEQSALEQTVIELKNTYGPTLLFICDHATVAVAEMQAKHGDEKGQHLKQHTDNAKQWALQLGLLGGSVKVRDFAAAQKLALHLEQRVENIRSHVVKLTKPDLFLQEALAKLEAELLDGPAQIMTKVALQRLVQTHFCTQETAIQVVVQSLEATQKVIPPPGRSLDSQRGAALLHLEHLKAASSGLLAFLATANRHDTIDNVLAKCHSAAIAGVDYLEEVADQILPEEVIEGVQLEDAWTKVMEVPPIEVTGEDSIVGSRQMVCIARFLLQRQRKTPTNLLLALKRKRAQLVHPSSCLPFVVLEFDQAFFMTIFLSPLLVTIRAGPRDGAQTDWTPLETNLSHKELRIWGASGSYSVLGGVVEGRLHYASAQATSALRAIWSSTLKAKSDFEIEISEGTALLEFIHLARQTYQPHFVEDES